jgi:hypothetical protein
MKRRVTAVTGFGTVRKAIFFLTARLSLESLTRVENFFARSRIRWSASQGWLWRILSGLAQDYIPTHVAFMLRGAAGGRLYSLEMLGNFLYATWRDIKKQGALQNARSAWFDWCGRRDSNPHGKSPKGF